MSNIFEEFQGADLDRLAECLKAIKQAGLKTDRHTQTGINEGSGNVWVWSDDWLGCVYCSIGFDVAWVWACPDCGEEYEFATYQELDDFTSEQYEKYDGCKSCCEEEKDAA
jgi:hypothetical protein